MPYAAPRPPHQGVSRILCSLARTHLVPPVFGRVSRHFLTPFNATALITLMALPLTVLSDLVTAAGGGGVSAVERRAQ